MAAGGRGPAQGGRGRGPVHMEVDYDNADWDGGYDQGYGRKRDRGDDRHRRRDRRCEPCPCQLKTGPPVSSACILACSLAGNSGLLCSEGIKGMKLIIGKVACGLSPN